MRRIAYLLTLLAACGGVNVTHGQELLSYSRQDGTSGLRLAWRADSSQAWTPIGNSYNFVNSDFGPWGSHKKMYSPRLVRNAGQNEWVLIWEANPGGGVTGVVRSKDLMKWAPQQYFASATDVPRDICPVHKLIPDSITIDGKTEYGFRRAGRGGSEVARGGTASLFSHGCEIVKAYKIDVMRCGQYAAHVIL